MNIYLARTYRQGLANSRYWVMFDSTRHLDGKPGESKVAVLKRWQDLYGKLPPRSVTRYAGAMRQSELAMTIGELRLEQPQ